MGEAILARGSASITLNGASGNALIRATCIAGATVTCTQGSLVYTDTSTGITEFGVGYGTWVVSHTANGKTKSVTIEVTELKIYEINLSGYTYGISIDMTDSDPASAVTYIGDAEGFTPLSVTLSSGACNYGSWKDIITDFIGCKPCLYKSGAVSAYLNPDNYAQTEAGATADITSGTYDVMVEFKKLWYRYAKNGSTLTFEIADYDRSDEGFVCTAFASMDGSGTIKDHMYFSAYEGYNSSNKTRSLSGKTPTGNVSYTNFRTYCKANGSLYGMEDWAKRFYILGLLMLVTKTRGIQAAVGYGVVSGSAACTTGTLNAKGLFCGYSNGTSAVKAFGIENMWGSLWNWCDGIITNSSTTVAMKAMAPYNDTGSGYETVADGLTRNNSLYATTMIPVLGGAAIIASVGQSSATLGWPDYVSVNSNSSLVARVGGYYHFGFDDAGPFCVGVNSTVSSTISNVGARLVAS